MSSRTPSISPMKALFLTAAVLFASAFRPGPVAGDECTERALAAIEEPDAAVTPPAWVEPGMESSVWRLAEASATVEGDDLRKCLLREAEADARGALAEDETSIPARLALAVILGMRADAEGGRTSVHAASELYEQLGKILEMEPDHARARHMLGRLHAGVRRMNRVTRWVATSLLGGGALKEASWEAAEANLAFAEEAVPEVADHHLQLANLYHDTDRPALALEEVRHVLALPVDSPMSEAVHAEASELAVKLGG